MQGQGWESQGLPEGRPQGPLEAQRQRGQNRCWLRQRLAKEEKERNSREGKKNRLEKIYIYTRVQTGTHTREETPSASESKVRSGRRPRERAHEGDHRSCTERRRGLGSEEGGIPEGRAATRTHTHAAVQRRRRSGASVVTHTQTTTKTGVGGERERGGRRES